MTEMKFEDQFAPYGLVKGVALSNFQRVVARRLTASWTQIPHVTHHDSVDVTEMEAFRKTFHADKKVSPLIFLVKALAKTLRAFPSFNASIAEDGKTLFLKDYVNIGVAVDGPLGLLVPVLHGADGKDIFSLSEELAQLSAQARDKGLPMSAMSGGCMTITSLGGIGGTAFSPIINQPEVAILGVTRTRMAPVWDGTAFQPRLMMPLSLSYDHRVINGADAARFVSHIGELLATPVDL